MAITRSDFIPPILYKIRHTLLQQRQGKPIQTQEECSLPTRPCHLQELFIKHDGSIYPCCVTWHDSEMKIGHVDEPDIIEKIMHFQANCRCERFRLREALPVEQMDYEHINIEFSLACQGACAMCCVDSPSWRGSYKYYTQLSGLLDELHPRSLVVQGGEVLIQKQTLDWIERTKAKYPGIDILLITNGNMPMSIVPSIAALFSSVIISFVGFQSATYQRIMGLDRDKTLSFTEALIDNPQIEDVCVKFLMLPLNLHEVNEFIEWAIQIGPNECLIQDAETLSYINTNTADEFWNKIIRRTSVELKNTLVNRASQLRAQKMSVHIDTKCRKMFGIDAEFLEENGLAGVVLWAPVFFGHKHYTRHNYRELDPFIHHKCQV